MADNAPDSTESALSPEQDALLRFAGGIAHELNNALTPLAAHAELARSASREEVAEHLDQIQEGVRRATEVVRRLLVVGSRAPRRLQPTDPGTLAREAAEALRFCGPARVVARVEPALPALPLDRELVREALRELGRNAQQACAAGSTVAVFARRRVQPGGTTEIELGVEDDGPGIAADLLQTAVDPYVTTRWNAGATGLGLAYVAGVASLHGGVLVVDSAPGWGTAAVLQFPAGTDRGDAVDHAAPGARLLLVDDDDAILSVGGSILRRHGFEVACAHGGQAALDAHAPGRFDGVLLDLTMPGLGGAEVLAALKRRDPELPVVIWTGHASDAESRNLLRLGARQILHKPFDVASLLGALAGIRRHSG